MQIATKPIEMMTPFATNASAIEATSMMTPDTKFLHDPSSARVYNVTSDYTMSSADKFAQALRNVNSSYTYAVETTNSSNTTDASSHTTIEMAVLGLLAALTSLVTICGNLVVILSFILERTIRQPSNYFIASLAVSDLLIGSVSMPFYTVYLLAGQYWPLGEKLCDLWLSIDYTVCLCSIYTVFCITVDRFCSVIVPAKYRNWRTERKVLVIICVTWTVPVLVFFTSIFGWEYFVGYRSVEEGKCYVQYMDSAVFNAVLQVGYFWITLVVMCGLYTGIYRVALRLQRQSEQKQRKTTTLVSVAGQAMTKIGIGMSKQPVEDGNPSFDRLSTVAEGLKENNVDGCRDANDYKCSPEEHSSSPAFSSDSDCNSPKLPLPSKVKIRSGRETKETQEKFKFIQSSQNSAPNPVDRETRQVDAKKETDVRDIGCRRISPLHPDLLHFGKKMQRISAYKDADNDEFPNVPPISDSKQDFEGNSNHSTDNIWLLRTASSSQSNDAELSNRNSTSLNSSPVWIRQSLQLPSNMDESVQMSMTDTRDISSDSLNFCSKKLPEPTLHVRSSDRSHTSKSQKCDRGLSSEADITVGCTNFRCFKTRNNSSVKRKPADEATYRKGEIGGNKGKRRRKERRADDENHRSGNSFKQRRRHLKLLKNGGCFESFGKRWVFRSGLMLPSGNLTPGTNQSSSKKKTSKSEDRAMKALRAITIILGAFVLCWTPWHVLSMIIGFCKTCVNPILYDVSYWLCYLNSPINPFCYAFANLQFKRTFVRIFKLDWHRT